MIVTDIFNLTITFLCGHCGTVVTHSPSTSEIRVQFIYLGFNIDFNATGHITMGSPMDSRKIHVAGRFLTSVKGKYKIRIGNKVTIEYIF